MQTPTPTNANAKANVNASPTQAFPIAETPLEFLTELNYTMSLALNRLRTIIEVTATPETIARLLQPAARKQSSRPAPAGTPAPADDSSALESPLPARPAPELSAALKAQRQARPPKNPFNGFARELRHAIHGLRCLYDLWARVKPALALIQHRAERAQRNLAASPALASYEPAPAASSSSASSPAPAPEPETDEFAEDDPMFRLLLERLNFALQPIAPSNGDFGDDSLDPIPR